MSGEIRTCPARKSDSRNSLVALWVGLCASSAGGTGPNPGQGTKIQQAVVDHGQNFFFNYNLKKRMLLVYLVLLWE